MTFKFNIMISLIINVIFNFYYLKVFYKFIKFNQHERVNH